MPEETNNLLELLPKLKGRRVVVLGDMVVDEFLYGEMKRVYGDVARTSREVAFGLMLRQQALERRPGGGANAVNNLLALGARPVPFGFVGSDETGRWLRAYFRRRGVSVAGLRTVRGWTTPTKMRILAGSIHAVAQQILRVDREELDPPPLRARRRLVATVRRALRGADALLVADYGYGSAAPELVNPLLSWRRKGLPVVVDSRFRARAFRAVTALTPSVPELEEAYLARQNPDVASLTRTTRRLLRETRAEAVLLTRGRQGMLLLERGRRPVEIPIFGTGQVADVTGAGDTVAAVFTAVLAVGAGYAEAARLANVAGGLVVMKRGTATVTPAELRRALRSGITQSRTPHRTRP